MKNFFVRIGIFFLAVIIAFFSAIITGFIVFKLWPYVFPVILPGLVANGTIAAEITFKQAICFMWFTNLLFFSRSSK